jgi:hypothetical protein
MRRWVLLVALLSLTACQRRPSASAYTEAVKVNMLRRPPAAMAAAAPAAADAAAAAAPDDAADPSTAAPPIKPEGTATTGPQLAFSYEYTLTVPARRLRGLEQAHEQACAAAGPTVCQMVGSEQAKTGDAITEAHLTLRAAPPWIAHFRQTVESQTNSAGGVVSNSKVSSEDLSRSIVDTQAQVRAKTTLRDRLQAILASRPGKLADVIEAERELSKVQEELDASQSELAMMRGRVDMSDLAIEYDSLEVAAPPNMGGPLRQALAGFFANMVSAIAVIVNLIAVLLPFAVVLVPLGWWGLRAWSRRKPKAPKEKA